MQNSVPVQPVREPIAEGFNRFPSVLPRERVEGRLTAQILQHSTRDETEY